MLERQLDNIIVEDLKLYVNLPRYRRLRGGKLKVEEKRQVQGNGKKLTEQCHSQRSGRIEHTSYAEVVAGKRRVAHNGDEGLSSVYLEPAEEVLKWLNDKKVSRMSNPANFDKVEDELRWDYGMDISTMYLGDDMVLVFGLNAEKAEQLMNQFGHSTLPLFYSMQKWSPNLLSGYRLA